MIVEFLANRTWRNIRVVALAHNLRFYTRQTKAEGFDYVRNALLTEGRLAKLVRKLSHKHQRALMSLKANQGSMPVHYWERAYGKIRPYKPWRADCPKYPWKRPASVAEQLWLWGLVEIVKMPPGKPTEIALCRPVMELLPPVPRPKPQHERARPPSLAHAGDLRADIATLMGKLMGESPKLVHGRWMPPNFVKCLSKHTLYKEETRFLRSELQSGRIRTLHYLALVTGLISVQHGTLQPTVAGWAWLKKPDLSLVWSAIRFDLRQRYPLWARFRFPEVNLRVWDVLLEQLASCSAGRTYTIRDLLETIYLRVPDQPLRKIPKLLRTILTWIGRVSVRGRYFTVHPMDDYQAQSAKLSEHEGAFYLDLPEHPPLHATVQLWSWASADRRSLCVDQASVRRAVGLGYAPQEMIRQLADCGGQPIPVAVAERIHGWCKHAEDLTLKQMTVLSSPNRETINRIRSDWRLRPFWGHPLSPHHIVVKPHFADKVCHKLAKRDLPVTRHQQTDSNKPLVPEHDIAEYLYLATEVYRQLGRVIPVDTKITGAVVDWVGEHLDSAKVAGLDLLVESTMDALNGAITGKLVAQGGVAQIDPEGIRQAVEYAYEECESLTIEYFSPASGQTTVRNVEPIMLYQRNGASYMEAYCNLDNAERTFRIDRILRVVDPMLDDNLVYEVVSEIKPLSA